MFTIGLISIAVLTLAFVLNMYFIYRKYNQQQARLNILKQAHFDKISSIFAYIEQLEDENEQLKDENEQLNQKIQDDQELISKLKQDKGEPVKEKVFFWPKKDKNTGEKAK